MKMASLVLVLLPWLALAQTADFEADDFGFVRLFEQAEKDEAWTTAGQLRERLLLVRQYAARHAIASDPVSDRYLVTCYGGPIDLVHFLALAAEVVSGKPLGKRLYQEWVAEGGPKNQRSFNWSQPPEAHPDDLPSNALGALFGWELKQQQAGLQTDLRGAFIRFIIPLIPVPDRIAKTFSHREIVMGLPEGKPSPEMIAERYGWFTAVPFVQTDAINKVAVQHGKPLCIHVDNGRAALAKAGLQVKNYRNQPILIIRCQ